MNQRHSMSPFRSVGALEIRTHVPKTPLPARGRGAGVRGETIALWRLAPTLFITLLLLALAHGAGIAQDRARELPPPGLAPLLRFAVPALEKPAIPIPKVEYPAAPAPMPDLPVPRAAVSWSVLPVLPLPAPRALACNPLGSVFGVAGEMLECGKAKVQRGELEPARADFTGALQKSTDREVVRSARYWLAETLLRLNRPQDVDRHLAVVVQDDPRGEVGMYAAHTLGWLYIDRGESERALAIFEPLLKSGAPPDMIPWARHGRARALYGLARYADARQEWTALINQSIPRALATEASFWLGETLGRLGDAGLATRYLQVFSAGGPHPLLETALMRLGWWRRAAGHPVEAIKTYRGLLAAYPQTAEGPWARAGLVLALVDVDDYPAAREEARELERRDPNRTLTLPVLIAMSRRLAEKSRTPEAVALHQELLSQSLEPAARAYVLLMSAEGHYQAGETAEARSRLELVRNAPGRPAYGLHAALRLAQTDLAERNYTQARAAAEGLIGGPASADTTAAALIVAGEAAYWSRDYDRAAGHFARFLADVPASPAAPVVKLALGWTELRRGRVPAARQALADFARDHRADPRLPAVLLLSAELAQQAGDERAARGLLDQLIARFPDDELAAVATLNRAVLAIRGGRAAEGLRGLSGVPARAALSPHLPRIRVARGVALIETGRLDEARPELQDAVTAGEDDARLGLGRIAFARRQWDEAVREFLAVRDARTGPVAAAAEYGLAAALYNQGKKADFARLAAPLVAGRADPATMPHLLAALAGIAIEEKKWPAARALTSRLVGEFSGSPLAPPALAALGAAASRDQQWPIAREAYQIRGDRYASVPSVQSDTAGQLDFAEALLRTGASAEARTRLESFAGGPAKGPQTPRALALLAQAREAQGDRPGAIEAYARLRQEHPGAPAADTALLGQARLLQAEGRWDQARPALERALDAGQPAAAAEAAYLLGEGLRGAGKHQDAVEHYMTAAYMAPDTSWGRRALLGAGQSFVALKQRDAAEIVYRKLVAAKDVEAELADAARKELRALGVN
jgi:TolA-binding protein